MHLSVSSIREQWQYLSVTMGMTFQWESPGNWCCPRVSGPETWFPYLPSSWSLWIVTEWLPAVAHIWVRVPQGHHRDPRTRTELPSEYEPPVANEIVIRINSRIIYVTKETENICDANTVHLGAICRVCWCRGQMSVRVHGQSKGLSWKQAAV